MGIGLKSLGISMLFAILGGAAAIASLSLAPVAPDESRFTLEFLVAHGGDRNRLQLECSDGGRDPNSDLCLNVENAHAAAASRVPLPPPHWVRS